MADLPSFFPESPVADHEVYIAFDRDSEAIAFREWLSLEGFDAFKHWLECR